MLFWHLVLVTDSRCCGGKDNQIKCKETSGTDTKGKQIPLPRASLILSERLMVKKG